MVENMLNANQKEFAKRLLDTKMTNEEIAPYLSLTAEEVCQLRVQLV